MIPRTARRPDRVEIAGLLRVAPGFVNRRNDDERPEPFLVFVPPGGLSLRAAWSACWAWAEEAEDGRPGAAHVAFMALCAAHEASELRAVDEWCPGSGRSFDYQAFLADVAGGYLNVPDFERGEGLADATVVRNDDGLLVVNPPTPAALLAATTKEHQP